jgi:hypothetical protein
MTALTFAVWQMEEYRTTWVDADLDRTGGTDLHTLTLALPPDLVAFATFYLALAKSSEPLRNLAEDVVQLTWNRKTSGKTSIENHRFVVFETDGLVRGTVLLPSQPARSERVWYQNLQVPEGDTMEALKAFLEYDPLRTRILPFLGFLVAEGYKAKLQHNLV